MREFDRISERSSIQRAAGDTVLVGKTTVEGDRCDCVQCCHSKNGLFEQLSGSLPDSSLLLQQCQWANPREFADLGEHTNISQTTRSFE